MPDAKRTYRGVSADDRRDRRRRLLLDACLDLIGAGGTAAVTAESVSAHAKLTKRYFYESFAGRDALLVAALDEMFVDLVADIRQAIADADDRAQAITEAFVTAMCRDQRRARLYAEAPAIPALRARREEAVGVFTDLLANQRGLGPEDLAARRLLTRIIVSGVTDVVTSWINGTLVLDRETLTQSIARLGRTVG